MAVEAGLHTGVWGCPGVWIPNRGYIQMFVYAQVFGSPRRYIQAFARGYTQVFGVPTGATHGCLESQTGDCASCQTGCLEGVAAGGGTTWFSVTFPSGVSVVGL